MAQYRGNTPRNIQLLFRFEATSFSDDLRNQRLAWVHRMLSDPRNAGVAISKIAYDAGFGDLSHFNRVFRRAHGAAPSDVRTAARGKKSN